MIDDASDASRDGVHWSFSCHVCGGAKEHCHTMIDRALGK
jgi:hypothetical protein